ncbi:MAG: hypothetical protein V2J24_02185 [Pseudomonadales bacterium]|nr:hypothetical protein [Pseudomonadales bacterium]
MKRAAPTSLTEVDRPTGLTQRSMDASAARSDEPWPPWYRHPDGHLGAKEGSFRSENLVADRHVATWLLSAWACLMGLLLIYQFAALATVPGFDVVRALNGANLASTVLAALACARASSPQRLDLVAGTWFLVLVGLIVVAQQFSGPRIAHGGAVLVITSCTLLLPTPFLWRVVPALGITAASIVNGLAALETAPALAASLARNIVVMLLALALAIVVSARLMRERRRRFLAEQARLEAMAEAAEVGRLLPVCAYCNQMRRDDGYWESALEQLARRRILRGRTARSGSCCSDGSTASRESAPGGWRSTIDGLTVEAAARPAGDDEDTAPETPPAFDERACRRSYLQEDRATLAAFFAALALFFTLIVLRGMALEGLAIWDEAVQWWRLGCCVLTTLAFAVAIRLRSVAAYDRLAFGYLLLASGLSAMLLLRSPDPSGIMPVAAVVMIHVLLRNPLWQRALASGLLTAAASTAIYFNAHLAGFFNAYTLLALVFANVIGIRAARLQDEARRGRFVALREREQAIERAEQLDLLMPMCESCGKVRDDAGYWQDVFDYLARHSDYKASHGICPACVRIHFPEFADDAHDVT